MRDSYGYESRRRFEHRFANALYVAPPTGGTVTAARALHVEKPTGGTLRAACYEQGCTLTAKAAAGYRFAGWYADEGHSELLCGTETYSFVPATYRTWIYPYFEASKVHIITDIYKVSLECDAPYEVDQDEESFIVPAGSRCTLRVNYELPLFRGWYDQTGGQNVLLGTARSITFTATEKRAVMPGYLSATNLSAAGTANSYIAAAHNAGYRFNSRVQGNGRATTGLTPATLSGTTARVLWESGGTRAESSPRWSIRAVRSASVRVRTTAMPLSGCSTLRDAVSGRGISGIRTTILGPRPRPALRDIRSWIAISERSQRASAILRCGDFTTSGDAPPPFFIPPP